MRVLVVDDDKHINDLLVEYFSANGHEAVGAGDGKEGIALCGRHPFDVAIIDIFMPVQDGMEMILYLRSHYPDIKIIAISGMFDYGRDYLKTAELFGANAAIEKPFSFETLLHTAEKLTAA
jgi:DNA-binding response OmpR family regulator